MFFKANITREVKRLIMLERVGFNHKNNVLLYNKTHTAMEHDSMSSSLQVSTPVAQAKIPSALLEKYYVNFGAKIHLGPENKQEEIEERLSDTGRSLFKNLKDFASRQGQNEITPLHVFALSLGYLKNYTEELDSGRLSYGEANYIDRSYEVIENLYGEDIFKNPKLRKKILKVINNEIDIVDKKLTEEKPQNTFFAKNPKKIPLSKPIENCLYSFLESDENNNLLLNDTSFLLSAINADDNNYRKEVIEPFFRRISNTLYPDETPLNDRIRLKFFDNKAKNLWSNLALGTNMVALYEKDSNPNYLINSFLHLFDETPEGFGRFKKQNTKFVILNDHAPISYVNLKLHEAVKDKSNNHVFIFDMHKSLLNYLNKETKDAVLSNPESRLCFGDDFAEVLNAPPQNVNFIVLSEKDKYYKNMEALNNKKALNDYGQTYIPVINLEVAKKIFAQEPALTKTVKKEFSNPAVQKCVEVSNQLEGSYPEKVLKLMNKISSIYIEQERPISVKDVDNFIKETNNSFKTAENTGSVKMILDTKIKLNDLVGTISAKKEAQLIIDQIKDKSIGTKGFIICTQDGSVGGGRKYTAQAIAGQAKIPYVEINAMDFGTKEVDLFGGGNLSPEKSIEKLFGQIKAQAETNTSKSAVLFIENFEYFSVGERVSQYHEKAMARLLREMDIAQEQGWNIVIMGSMSDPRLIGESTSKSLKFNDIIEVDSPAYDKKARLEIIDYYSKKKGLKIAGETPEEKQSIFNSVAETTNYFSFIEILSLLDKAKNVTKERKHKETDKADFVEAYLRLESGRSSAGEMSEHRKKIVTSHECGHALTLTIMHNLAEKQNIPWRLPDKVNFITLDPRGEFGGAMYHKQSKNEEYSFERVFADLVCNFGGHSCEKKFYNIDGSWGITGDLEHATHSASLAVGIMGQGKHFGKKSLSGSFFVTEKEMNLFNKDVDVLLKNSQYTSDNITEAYSGFVQEFTDRHYAKVATGECLILGEDFEKELQDWKEKQPEAKREELKMCDTMILEAIKASKRGNTYK